MDPVHPHDIRIQCSAFIVASLGFSLSLLVTVLNVFSSSSEEPVIVSPQSKLLRDKARRSSYPPSTTLRRRTPKLIVDVERRESSGLTSIELGSEPLRSPQQIPIIEVSPPPPAEISQSSTDTLSSSTKSVPKSPVQEISNIELEASVPSDVPQSLTGNAVSFVAPTPPEERDKLLPEERSKRVRFSKIKNLFITDKRAKINRRSSLPALQTEASVSSPSSLHVTFPDPPPIATPAGSPCPIKRRSSTLISRTASCPGLHHLNSNCASPTIEDKSEATSPQSPRAKKAAKEKKEALPRLRTNVYEAPYFIPPPDSVDVVEPFPLGIRPSRRRMPPPEKRRVTE
ncbi:hypothetical protein C8J57DRAFT_1490161 [Mycena rebaudengoi]|nr:hypothetical protein C8J57DRAFT_1490161 [Mycena rebaudengoi]